MNQTFDIEIQANENLEYNIKQIALKLRPEWNDKRELETKCVKSGVTNSLFACYLKSFGLNHKETILFRIYSKNSDKVIERTNEIEAMRAMQKHELGPKYYGKFKNGIFYEFLPGSILDLEMLNNSEIYCDIAKAMAQLHFTEFKGFTQEYDFKSDKEIFIFREIWKLFSLVLDDYKLNMPKMTDELFKLIPSKQELKSEIENYQSHMINLTRENKSLIVFSHNDLFPGNIIYNKQSEKKIKFIDYEYSGRNYQAYDIANHFNEFAGVESPDYSYFPNKDYQLIWLTIYLNEFNALKNTLNYNDKVINLVEFYEEVNKFTLASHLMWGLWGLVQAQVSECDYDYDFVTYSSVRFIEYFKRKIELNI